MGEEDEDPRLMDDSQPLGHQMMERIEERSVSRREGTLWP
jgi:hypothetical protein